MADAFNSADALGIYLSGALSDGGAQPEPVAALGGYRSSREVKGMGYIIGDRIPAIAVLNATPNNGEGTGFIRIDGNGDLFYIPPNGTQGNSVTIAAGETKFLEGSVRSKGVRVYRSPDFAFSGQTVLNFVEPFGGVMGMGDIPNADRDAGETYYRAFFIYAHGAGAKGTLFDLVLAQGSAGPRQSVLEFASEVPVGDAIQTIADEKTAPIGVSFESVLSVGDLLPGEKIGIWVKKTFPGHGAGRAREKVGVDVTFKVPD